MKILYLTTSCFDKGGVSRYSNYQIRAFRELYGEDNIKVISFLGPDKNSFEERISVFWHGDGISYKNKIHFTFQACKIAFYWRPNAIHAAHVSLSSVAHVLAKFTSSKSFLNTYGLEVWSGFKTHALWGLKNSNFIISDCHYTADYLERKNLRTKGSINVIWDCADLQRFKPGSIPETLLQKYNLPSPNNHFVIMTLGRISRGARHKGYERLVEVFKIVSNKNDNARLVFIGGGNFIDDLKEMTNAAGLGNKTSFTNRITEKELNLVYRCASVFSLVSDRGKGRGEGIPLTPIEAMACGKPVIVGNQDGSQEAVDNERNGWVIDPYDLNAHAEILIQLSNDKSLLDLKSKEAQKVVQERFSFETFKTKHLQVYQKNFNI